MISGVLDVLVEHVDAETFPDTLQIGHVVRDFFDGIDLFLEELRFQEVAKIGILEIAGYCMNLEETLKVLIYGRVSAFNGLSIIEC